MARTRTFVQKSVKRDASVLRDMCATKALDNASNPFSARKSAREMKYGIRVCRAMVSHSTVKFRTRANIIKNLILILRVRRT